MAPRWQELLKQLTQELEKEHQHLRQLQLENAKLRASAEETWPKEVESILPKAVSSIVPEASTSTAICEPNREKNLDKITESFHLQFTQPSRVKEVFLAQRSTTAAMPPWYVVDPEGGRYLHVWQPIVSVALAWATLITPLQACIMELRVSPWMIFSWLVDLVFVMDLILHFFVQQVRHTTRGIQRVTRLDRIALHYVQTWFLPDLVAAIPFDVAGLYGLAPEVARVLWLLKLLRLIKPGRLLAKIEIPYSIPHQQHWLLARFLLLLTLVCHWLACLWALTLKLVSEEYPRWMDDISEVDQLHGATMGPARVYVAAFYFSSYTMTSVGYGDMGPQNLLERLVATFMVMCSGFCWAYVLGQVCNIVADINEESQSFRQRMHHLNLFMRSEGLPRDLKRRLRSFFLHNRSLALHNNQLELLGMMSPQLRSEVCSAVNLPWLQKVSVFNTFMKLMEDQERKTGLPAWNFRACIAEVSQRLEALAFAQQEHFEHAQVLCILSKGLAMINNQLEHKGAVWGEDFVLSNINLIQPVKGNALTYAEILTLRRESFMDVIETCRKTCPQLGQICNRFAARLGARRAILEEARRRRLGKLTL